MPKDLKDKNSDQELVARVLRNEARRLKRHYRAGALKGQRTRREMRLEDAKYALQSKAKNG
jgi:hypothetical protein